MGMLDKMENYAYYRAVLDLIEKEEMHDKNRSTVNGEELFLLCHEQYRLMNRLLLPLKEKLKEDINVTNIFFTDGFQQDTNMIVEYEKDERKAYFAISNYDFDTLEFISGTSSKDMKKIVDKNKKIIEEAFKICFENNFDEDITIRTASRRFVFKDDMDEFSLNDTCNADILSLSGTHSYYETMGTLLFSKNKNSCYKKVNKLLKDEVMGNILKHAKVYEDEMPKVLIKK